MLPAITPVKRDRKEDIERLQRRLENSMAKSQPDEIEETSERRKTWAAGRHKSVVIIDAEGDPLPCPECGMVFDDETSLKRHVFSCRIENGTDPMLPLTILQRSPRRSRPSQSPRRMIPRKPKDELDHIIRPISSTVEARVVFQGRAPPQTARAGTAPGRSRSSNVHIWERALHRFSPSRSSRRPAPPTSRSTRSSRSKRQIFRDDAEQEKVPVAPSQTGGRFVASRGVAVEMPALEDDDVASGESSRVHSAVEAMLQNLNADEADEFGAMLDLEGMLLGENESAVLRSLLIPGPSALPITTLNMKSTKHHGSLCKQQVCQALVRNTTLIQLHLEGSDLITSEEGEPQHHDRYLHAAVNRIEARRQGRVREEDEADFDDMVDSYKQWQADRAMQRKHFNEQLREGRRTIQREEAMARKDFGNYVATVFNRLINKKNRQEAKELRQVAREEVLEEEEICRYDVESFWLDSFLGLFEFAEEQRRVLIRHEHDQSRIVFRFKEREAIFRAKIQEIQRTKYESIARNDVLERLQIGTTQLLAESQQSLDVMKRLERRHFSQALWKQKARQEINSFDDYAEKSIKSIINEAVNFWQTNREKLNRALEAVRQKYLAQQEALCTKESQTRTTFEDAMWKWLDLSTERFYLEFKLLQVRQKATTREEVRLALLHEKPVVSVLGLDDKKPRMFCTSSAGHPAPPFIGMFPGSVHCSVKMRPEWTQLFSEAQHRCKACLVEERSVMSEALTFSSRYERVIVESFNTAFAENVPLDMRPILAITKPLVPPTPQNMASSQVGNEESASDLAASPSSSITRRKSSVRRRQSKNEAPSSPQDLTCDHFLAHREKLMAWRVAWADRLTTTAIRNQKERIRGGTIKFHIDSETPALQGSDRLQTSIETFNFLIDGDHPQIEVSDETPLTVPEIGLETSVSLRKIEDTETSMSLSDNGQQEKPTFIPAQRELEVTLVKKPPEFKDIDFDATMSQSMASIEEESTTNIVAEEFDPIVYEADLTKIFQSVMYKNTTEASSMQQPSSSCFHRIRYEVCVEFEVCDRYSDVEAKDGLGYAPLAPDENNNIQPTTMDGSVFIAIVPSSICLVGDTQQSVTTLAEKEDVGIDKAVIFDKCVKDILPPWTLQRDEDGDAELPWRLVEPNPAVGYNNGSIDVEIIGAGSEVERLSLMDDEPTLSFTLQPRNNVVQIVKVHEQQIATFASGTLQSTHHVNKDNALKAPPTARYIIGNDKDKVVSGSALCHFIHQLRFHNLLPEPEEGERIVRVSVTSADGGSSIVEAPLDIERYDAPTKLEVAYEKVNFRAASHAISNTLKPFVLHTYVPVFTQSDLVDPDTDRFSGGWLNVKLTTPAKGDALVLVPETNLLYPTTTPLEKKQRLTVRNDGAIIFEDRVVAMITEGQVVQDDGQEPEYEALEFHCDFAHDDQCSIKAAETIIRHIALVNTAAPYNFKAHQSAAREVELDMRVIDESEEQCSPCDGKVVVKGCGHVIQVAEKGTTFEYKESLGAVKLGNFDVSNDRINPINNFATGFLLVTVTEGFDNDVITIKPDESEYRFIEFGDRTKGKKKNINRLKAVAHEVGHKKHGLTDLVKDIVKKGHSKKQEIIFYGQTNPMACLTRVSNGILIEFYKDNKKDQVTRRQVIPLLRNLMYQCENPSPNNRVKIVRVQCSDHIASTPSQCLVNINVETVDEVTEIKMKSNKLRYIQQPGRNLPLLPHGRSILLDDDTEYFDGGLFEMLCVAGSTKGDTLQMIPPHLQGHAQRVLPEVDGLTTQRFDNLSMGIDGTTFLLDNVVVGQTEFTSKDGGHNSCKISFAAAASGEPKLVSRELASYMMNSICFGNSYEKLRDTNRNYQLRIKDIENPVDGKAKLTLSVNPPHFSFNYGPQTPFEYFFASSRKIPTLEGCCFEVVPKAIAVSMEKYNPHSTAPMAARFVAEVKGEQSELVELGLPLATLNLTEKDDRKVYQAKDLLFRIEESSPSRIEIAFESNCNTRVMTKAMMLNVIKALTLTVRENLAVESDVPAGSALIPPVMNLEGDELRSPGSQDQSAARSPPPQEWTPQPGHETTPPAQELFIDGPQLERQNSTTSEDIPKSATRSRRASSIRSKTPRTPSIAAMEALEDVEGPHVLMLHMRMCDGDNEAKATVKLVPHTTANMPDVHGSETSSQH